MQQTMQHKTGSQPTGVVYVSLQKLSQPTLVLTGTEDLAIPGPANSLIITSKVPGAWLLQIKDAAHAIVTQYPEKLGIVTETFLSTVK